jgi:dinuclear metal center YbgI/SA1388 family protein
VAVYSPHTAFDNAHGGINDLLASRLGLVETGPLRRRAAGAQFKVVVFVPDQDLGRVSDALFAAGAGQIGQYSQCSFRLPGTGTFFGSDAAHPTIGEKGRREEVSEWRLEAVCPEPCVESVIQAIRRSHTYEEPAFDVYSLRPGFDSLGDGRVGHLPRPVLLADLARSARAALQAALVQMVGDPSRSVERVAIVCGAGGEMLPDALKAGVDVFLTGELRFHDYLAARSRGLALLLPGHYATERLGVEELARALQRKWPDVGVWAAQKESDPVNGVAS